MCYKNLEDIPLYNFRKILKTGDYKYLLEEGEVKNGVNYNDIWDSIYEEYFDTYAYGREMKDLTHQKIKTAIKKIEYNLEPTGIKKTLMNLEVKKLEVMQEKLSVLGGSSEIETKVNLQKYLGYPIVETQIGAKEYFETLKVVSNQIKQDGSRNKG